MIRKRIRFAKLGQLKFIGHLDLLRVFQRLYRRAAIPLSYSQGFNPHPLLSFASPLGLGVTSEDEYADIALDAEMDNEEIIVRMNRQAPEGLTVLGCWDMPEGEPAAMAVVRAAEYRIVLPEYPDWAEKLPEFMEQDSLLLRKQGKKNGHKQWMEIDCKPMLYEYELLNASSFRLLCACGSRDNLKAEAMLETLYQWMGHPEWLHEEQIHRLHLYREAAGEWVLLSSFIHEDKSAPRTP